MTMPNRITSQHFKAVLLKYSTYMFLFYAFLFALAISYL